MKMSFPVALVGLLSLVACGQRSTEVAAVQNADALQAELENQANAMEAMADATADRNAADAIDNAADDLANAGGNVADARSDTMR